MSDKYQPCAVIIEGRSFCFTGRSHIKRDRIRIFVEGFGGVFHKAVTKSTSYLVVCGGGSKRWKYGSYGVKLNTADKLVSGGGDICIISENDFWDQIFDIAGRNDDLVMDKGA